MNRFLKTLALVIPFCYIAMGCLLMTDLFADMAGGGRRIAFGIIIIIYGVYRIYRARTKTRDI